MNSSEPLVSGRGSTSLGVIASFPKIGIESSMGLKSEENINV